VSDLRDLYQDLILEHGKEPRNFRVIEDANGTAEGYNPLCGDRVHVYVKREGDTITDLAFTGDGCAISRASASLMTQALKGRTTAEADALHEAFHALVTGTGDAASSPVPLGKLEVFGGVAEFPVRVKCASLAWHTLRAALAGADRAVTTE
jgi:nitrogen fixation NifU-like protein